MAVPDRDLDLARSVLALHVPIGIGGHHAGRREVCRRCWSQGGSFPCEAVRLARAVVEGQDAPAAD